jgi:hypothetical protein
LQFKIIIIIIFSIIQDLIASWNSLLNWSENAATARRLQDEIATQKQLLDSFDTDKEWVLNSEEAIREKIHELNVSFRFNESQLSCCDHFGRMPDLDDKFNIFFPLYEFFIFYFSFLS